MSLYHFAKLGLQVAKLFPMGYQKPYIPTGIFAYDAKCQGIISHGVGIDPMGYSDQ